MWAEDGDDDEAAAAAAAAAAENGGELLPPPPPPEVPPLPPHEDGSGFHLDHHHGHVLDHLDAEYLRQQNLHRGDFLPPPRETSLMMVEDHVKLPTAAAKQKSSLLLKYGRKLGLNERGCHAACALAALAAALFVAVVAMAVNWPASPYRYAGPLHFCGEPPCLEAAVSIVAKRNDSYDPCTDFWKYACDGWLNSERLPPAHPSWGPLDRLGRFLRVEKSRLVTMTSHEPSQINSIEWKVQNFYQSCMSLGFIESDREKPLVKLINSLGGWDVLRSFSLYSWDSQRVLRELHAEHRVNAFFKVDVVPHPRHPDHSVIRISPDGLGMPDRSYYHRLPDDPAIAAYQAFMKDSAQLFGASTPQAHKFSVDMFNFEKRISEITPNAEYLSDPRRTSNSMSVKHLYTMSMNIPWLEILKAAFSDAQLTEESEVLVSSPQYAADIAVILSTTDRGSLNNYLMWKLVHAYMPFLSKTFREVVELYRRALTGAEKPLERWEFCEKTTEGFFGHLLNALLAREQPRLRRRRDVVKKLFDYIKHNVAKSISVSPSYDYAARRTAMTKLKNMTVQVGTPDFMLERKYLKLLYNRLEVQKTDFFQNIQYGMRFLRKREELSLVTPSEESRWLHLLLDNAQVGYSHSANKVVVPEAFLQPPLFHADFPHSVNLGGVGVRLAEAVINGVSGFGLLFDESGALANNASQAAFDAAARCLMRRLSARGVDTPDYLLKCQRSTAASASAVQQTFLSLQDMLEMEQGEVLPALETLDPQSIFFLSYAQSLCRQQTFRQRDLERSAGRQLLEQERLMASLAETPQFQQHFFCAEPDLGDEDCAALI